MIQMVFFFFTKIYIYFYISNTDFVINFFFIFDKITSLDKKEKLFRVDPQSEVLQKRCGPTHD